MRQIVGPDILLVFEAAGMQEGWIRETQQNWAQEVATVLQEEGYLWIEEPLRTSDRDAIDEYKAFKYWMSNSLPMAGGQQVMLAGTESLVGLDQFLEWSDSVDIFQPDGPICGGTSLMIELRLRLLQQGKACIGHGYSDPLAVLFDVALVGAISREGYLLDRLVEVPEHCLHGEGENALGILLDEDGTIDCYAGELYDRMQSRTVLKSAL